jgi:hypothetical protein
LLAEVTYTASALVVRFA